MTSKTTHIEKVRRENAAVKMQVQNLLGWDDLQYASLQEDMGREYLKSVFGEGTPLVDDIPNHREFWSWWTIHWLRRDREFLELAGMLFPYERESYYRDLHNPNGVAFFPHSVILEETYNKMIHKLVKEAVK